MSLTIVRNDITKMETQAIVNTANEHPVVGTGCDYAIYKAAGYDKLLQYRKKYVGDVEEGKCFITPGFALKAEYIIHAVSPVYRGGAEGEEEKLRSCYRESLRLAKENGITSIAFPLISTGGFGYPKEEGMRIAVDEINTFLLSNRMKISLVVFGKKATNLGQRLYPDLEAYINENYVSDKYQEEYGFQTQMERRYVARQRMNTESVTNAPMAEMRSMMPTCAPGKAEKAKSSASYEEELETMEKSLSERMAHMTDTFSEYLMYLIEMKGLENAQVWKSAIIDKKVFSKIKNNPDYHPKKLTVLCLCIGAKLNLDEAKDLMARAGYALSPCDKTDIIFSYFIENKIYDMIELDIQLEEHGLPCIIS